MPGMDGAFSVSVLRKRSDLSAVAGECADLARNCLELSALDRPRHEGTRCVLVWIESAGARKLGGLFPFGAPALYRGLPLVALRCCTPLLRKGWAQATLNALLDWFRADGEGAALLEFGRLARGGPVYRAFLEVARRRDQLVLATRGVEGKCTLLVGDRAWDELSIATLPLLRWAKRGATDLVYL